MAVYFEPKKQSIGDVLSNITGTAINFALSERARKKAEQLAQDTEALQQLQSMPAGPNKSQMVEALDAHGVFQRMGIPIPTQYQAPTNIPVENILSTSPSLSARTPQQQYTRVNEVLGANPETAGGETPNYDLLGQIPTTQEGEQAGIIATLRQNPTIPPTPAQVGGLKIPGIFPTQIKEEATTLRTSAEIAKDLSIERSRIVAEEQQKALDRAHALKLQERITARELAVQTEKNLPDFDRNVKTYTASVLNTQESAVKNNNDTWEKFLAAKDVPSDIRNLGKQMRLGRPLTYGDAEKVRDALNAFSGPLLQYGIVDSTAPLPMASQVAWKYLDKLLKYLGFPKPGYYIRPIFAIQGVEELEGAIKGRATPIAPTVGGVAENEPMKTKILEAYRADITPAEKETAKALWSKNSSKPFPE